MPSSNVKATEEPLPVGEGANDLEESQTSEHHTIVNEKNELIVDWDGPDDPANPKNWSYKKKWAVTAILSSFNLIAPLTSTIIAPASESIGAEFGVTSSTILALTTSIFVLAFAIGPLLLGPMSEIFGRTKVIQISNIWYLGWNLGCAFAKDEVQLIVFRFLAGLGGSAPLSVGGGVLSDVWRPEERGQSVAIYSLVTLNGPVLGPVIGAWIAQKSTWRWAFRATCCLDGVVLIVGFFFMRETFAPVLLERKANKIRKNIDAEKGSPRVVRTIYDGQDRSWKTILSVGMLRPFVIFFREPIIQVLGAYMAFTYGLLYIFYTTMTSIYNGIYGESIGIGGLQYFALGIGLTIMSQVNARMMDYYYRTLKKKNNGIGKPEFRLPCMFPGAPLTAAGLLINGWAAQERVHWVVADVGMLLVGMGTILPFQTIQSYVIDCFTLYAASAMASVNCLRSLAGFAFPLFAPSMYNALGFGKGDTILAAVTIVLGFPAPFIIYKYGERIRKSSRYAKKS